MTYSKIKTGVVKKTKKMFNGLFIDGVGLDRATRRLNRKVEISKLVSSLSKGKKPVIARYYTIIPYEDDSRHRSYLDALERAGLEVIVKRLPPKGVNRQVDIYPEMSADIVAFALGHHQFSDLSRYKSETLNVKDIDFEAIEKQDASEAKLGEDMQKIVTVVCPGRELSYCLSLIKEFDVDTVNADFGQFAGKDVLKNAAKWIDLADSEIIWREAR